MDFKSALIRALKSIFCNPKGRLLEAKRACVNFELYENNLQKSMAWEYVVCRKQIDVAPNYILHI